MSDERPLEKLDGKVLDNINQDILASTENIESYRQMTKDVIDIVVTDIKELNRANRSANALGAKIKQIENFTRLVAAGVEIESKAHTISERNYKHAKENMLLGKETDTMEGWDASEYSAEKFKVHIGGNTTTST